MNQKKSFLGPLLVASGLAVVLSSAAIAAPQYDRDDRDHDREHHRSDRISTQGQITSINRERDQFRLVLNHGSYTYYVPVASVRNRDIRIGDNVRIGGVVAGDSVNADYIAFVGEPEYRNDPAYRGVPYGQSGWMSGTVLSVNRRLNYVTIRDDQSGLPVKIDVRGMDTRHSVNVWRTRTGDHISVNGSWGNRDTFAAIRVQY